MKLSSSGPAAGPARRGFALIVTIVLVAFLVLILVGLATFTRVETQVASNSQQLAQARQNALMALNLALGKLQETTGPDQRVTATADIAAAADGGRLAAGSPARNTASVNGTSNGLQAISGASVQNGTRYWTGVWGRAGGSFFPSAKSIYEETPSPVLLNWLVSGNEGNAFTVDASGLIGSASGASGDFTPASPVNWAAAGLDPVDPGSWSTSDYARLEIKAAGNRAVLLVGPASAGLSPDASGAAAVERYVVAPLKDITVPAAQVPGMGTTGTIAVGRYAWWVGDQGVKADFTVDDPHFGKNSPDGAGADDADARVRLLTSPRSGVELLADFAAMYPQGDDAQAAAKLGRLLQMTQAPMLASAVGAPLTNEQQRSRFHDLAVSSRGVLSDTQSGGLRKDLTFYFEKTQAAWNASDLAGEGIIPSSWSPEWSAGDYAPKWDWLYSFYNTNPSVASPALRVRPESATRLGVSPVVAQFRMILSTDPAALQDTVPDVKELSANTTFNLPVRCNVVFVLANPYNFPLRIDAGDMEILVKNEATGANGVFIRAATGRGKDSPPLATFPILRPSDSSAPDGVLDTVKFTVPALTISAGESVTLGVDGNGITLGSTNAASAEPANTVPLAERTGSDPVVSTDYFTARTSLAFTTTAAQIDASAALWQTLHEAKLAIIVRDGSGDLYQKVSPFMINKEGQVNSFAGSVFGTAHLKFLAPAHRLMDWSSPVALKSTFAYYVYGRPYVDYNVRAGLVTHPNVTTTGGTYFLLSPPSYGAGVVRAAAGGVDDNIHDDFKADLHPAFWAEDFDDNMRTAAARGVLFDFPRRHAEQPPVMSIAQLQHANLATDDVSDDHTIGYGAGYAVGNSYHHPHVTRGAAVQARTNKYPGAPGATTRYFDMSYLLNTALWDGYFFSGIPQGGADFASFNPRYELSSAATAANVRTADSAAHLSLRGAFNVNSTSKEAWVALLGGLNGRRVNDDNESTGVPYPRSLWQPEHSNYDGANATFQTSGTGDEPYAGYRRLTTAEIDRLAEEIVKRVRARGPFVSLSHFINRTLVAASSDFNESVNDANGAGALADPSVPMGRGLAGPLQAAIDSAAAGLNTFVGSGKVTADGDGGLGDRVLFNGEIASSTDHKPNSANTRDAYYADKAVDAPHIDWELSNSEEPGPAGRTSTGIPGWLLQGDLLQAIGPALSARSDTFVIRAYGEALNPTDPAQRLAGAWCEAVVQRVPEYVDPADPAETTPSALTSPTNQRFGRAYKIIEFRWLGPDDI